MDEFSNTKGYHSTLCNTDFAAGWNIPATWKEAARRANNLSQGFTANSEIWSRPQRTHALASVDFKHLEMGGGKVTWEGAWIVIFKAHTFGTFIRIDGLIQSCEELKKKQGQGESGVVRVI